MIQSSMFIVKASCICRTKDTRQPVNYIRLTLTRESCKTDRHLVVLFENTHRKLYSVIAGKLHTRDKNGIIPNFRIHGKGLYFRPM